MDKSYKLYPNAYKVSYMAHFRTLLGALMHINCTNCTLYCAFFTNLAFKDFLHKFALFIFICLF
jgi:hypothetical protein